MCGCLLGFCARRATPPSSAADCLARVLDQGAFLAAIESAVQVRLRQYKVCVGVWVGWSCKWMEHSMAGADGRTVSPLAVLPARTELVSAASSSLTSPAGPQQRQWRVFSAGHVLHGRAAGSPAVRSAADNGGAEQRTCRAGKANDWRAPVSAGQPGAGRCGHAQVCAGDASSMHVAALLAS